MGYKLRHPSIQSGSIQDFEGHPHEVVNWMFEVNDLHMANRMVEHSGCKMLGVDRIKMIKKIIVKRGQGLGDVLMMTPILRKIKEVNPSCSITYAVFPLFIEVLKYLPYIDRIVDSRQLGYHKDECWVTNEDGSRDMHEYWVNCDGIAERTSQEEINTKHRINIFADMAGVTISNDERRLDYRVTKEEDQWARQFLKEQGVFDSDKLLAMAVRSTAANRNMPNQSFREVSRLASEGGWRTVIFDHDGQFGWDGPGTINLAGKTTIRQMAAIMARCQMFFGPDTGAWHMSCALNVPNVVYFGAIDWKLRVTMPRTRVIFKNVGCYPCNRYDCHWPVRHECIDIDPMRCWKEIDAFDRQFASMNGPRITPLTTGIPEALIAVKDTVPKGIDVQMAETLARGQYVH